MDAIIIDGLLTMLRIDRVVQRSCGFGCLGFSDGHGVAAIAEERQCNP